MSGGVWPTQRGLFGRNAKGDSNQIELKNVKDLRTTRRRR